jgi:hypothetical protein
VAPRRLLCALHPFAADAPRQSVSPCVRGVADHPARGLPRRGALSPHHHPRELEHLPGGGACSTSASSSATPTPCAAAEISGPAQGASSSLRAAPPTPSRRRVAGGGALAWRCGIQHEGDDSSAAA